MPVRPRKSDGVDDAVMPDGELVLFHRQRSLLVALNPTAALVWELCDGSHEVGDVAAQLREIFPAAANADGDVRSLLADLCEIGMVGDAAPAP